VVGGKRKCTGDAMGIGSKKGWGEKCGFEPFTQKKLNGTGAKICWKPGKKIETGW